jgi:hypothetical protein
VSLEWLQSSLGDVTLALLFICEHCGEEIIADCFKPGDRVACTECGGHLTVPENAIETDQEPNNLARLIPPGDLETSKTGPRRADGDSAREEGLPAGQLERLLGETFAVWKRNLGSILIITVVPAACLNLIGHWLTPYLKPIGQVSLYGIVRVLGASLTLAFATVVFSAVTHGALIHLVSQRYATGSASVVRAFAAALSRVLRLVGARLMATILLLMIGIVGFVLFFLSGPVAGIQALAGFVVIIFIAVTLYLAVRWVFAEHVILLERCGAHEALARSEIRVKGHWWRIFGVLFVTYLILLVPGTVVFLVLVPVPAQVRSYIVQVAATPTIAIMTTLLYFDVRIRKERYGRKQLADALRESTE